jgi:dihydroorotate dehydrogenase
VSIHGLITDTSRLGNKLNGFVDMNKKKSDMRVTLGEITLKNPVLTASGTFGYAAEFEKLIDLNRLGGIIVKGLSLEASRGNPPPNNL